MTKVLVSDPIDQAGIDLLGQVAQVDQRTGLSEEELIGIIGEYDGLMIRSGTQVTAAVIAAASRLSYLYLQDNNYQMTGRISDIPSEFSYEKLPKLRVLCVPHPGSGDTQCWKG